MKRFYGTSGKMTDYILQLFLLKHGTFGNGNSNSSNLSTGSKNGMIILRFQFVLEILIFFLIILTFL